MRSTLDRETLGDASEVGKCREHARGAELSGVQVWAGGGGASESDGDMFEHWAGSLASGGWSERPRTIVTLDPGFVFMGLHLKRGQRSLCSGCSLRLGGNEW